MFWFAAQLRYTRRLRPPSSRNSREFTRADTLCLAFLNAVLCAGLLLGLTAPSAAYAYEFTARNQLIAQAMQLSGFRLNDGDIVSQRWGRQRTTHVLELSVWNIGRAAPRAGQIRMPPGGVHVSVESQLRIDHDFGEWSAGSVVRGATRNDALDAIPELQESVLAIDLLYAYLRIDGLWHGRAQLNVGRISQDDGFDFYAVDGVHGSALVVDGASAQWRMSMLAGVRVRAASPLGFAGWELDGTSAAGCQEYVEGVEPGSGSWQPIVRDRMFRNRRLTSDLEVCPQQQQSMPTIEVRSAGRWGRAVGEVGYRRTWSQTLGIIGDRNRLRYPDVGLYPNESGQAPASGVNQEVLYAHLAGKGSVAKWTLLPSIDARYSLLHGRTEQALIGVAASRGRHLIELSSQYIAPTFDGDSIFSIFAVDPAADIHLSYALSASGPVAVNTSGLHRVLGWRDIRGGPSQVAGLSARIDSWVRRYLVADGADDSAAGASVQVSRGLTPMLGVSWSAVADGGYAGRRIGSSFGLQWRVTSDAHVSVRGGWVSAVRESDIAGASTALTQTLAPVSESLTVRAAWRPAEFVGVAGHAEINHSSVIGTDIRIMTSLVLGFVPQP
jgi:hypothetical protein